MLMNSLTMLLISIALNVFSHMNSFYSKRENKIKFSVKQISLWSHHVYELDFEWILRFIYIQDICESSGESTLLIIVGNLA